MGFASWIRLFLLGASLGAVGCGGGGSSGGGAGGAGGEGGEGGASDVVAVSIADAEVAEGDAGTAELTFTVSLSQARDGVVRVAYATQDGIALAEGPSEQGQSDYESTSATLRFDPGETEQTLTIAVRGDVLNEADDTFSVVLSKPLGAVIEDGEAEGRIVNDDELPTISVQDISVAEQDSGTALRDVTFTLSTPSGRATSADWATTEASASADDDYLTAMDSVVFAPGETSKTVQIGVNGDAVDEPDETFGIELYNPRNAELADPIGTVTIVDDDEPATGEPALSIDNVALAEGNAGSKQLAFTVTLSEPSPDLVTVDYATIDATATAGGLAARGGVDYVSASDSLSFAPGETAKQVAVSIGGDTLNEGNETFLVELFNAVNSVVLDPQGVGTISNDDALPSISVGDETVAEGAAGTRSATFAVSLSQPSGRSVSVGFATSDDTASAAEDYVSASGTVTLEAGETLAFVVVNVEGDLLNEADEMFLVDLSNAVNASIADDQGEGTITNDDGLPQVTIDNVAITEGDAGSKNAVFSVILSTQSGQDVSVAWTTGDDTATAVQDYAAGSGSLSFPAGTTVRTLSIAVNGDVQNEPNEAFTIDLSNALGCTIVDGHGVGTIITDDSALPALNIEDASVTEGDAGTVSLSLTVTLDAPSAQQVNVNYGTANGSASSATDYQVATGTLSFDPGQTSKTIDVTIDADTLHEPDETLLVTLSGASNAFVADGEGIGTIGDDDTASTLSISDVTLSEGNAGTKNATFTISLSAASGFPISVTYATADGTAEEGGAPAFGQDDYEASSDVVVLAPLATSVQVSVPINGDDLAESNETFLVQLSGPQNATIADAQGQGTITNDDGVPTLSIDDVSALEGDAGTKTFTFTVTLSSPSGSQVSVAFATANGTANTGDYNSTSGTVVFDSGQTTGTIAVTVIGEKAAEAHNDETFFVNLSNALGATIADGQGLGTIQSDD